MEYLVLILIVLGMALGVTYIVLKEDKLQRGYKPDAIDRDGDGWIQEGTKWERSTTLEAKKAASKRSSAKKPVKKKSAVEKAALANKKKKPTKKK